jgi:hypothetical protein
MKIEAHRKILLAAILTLLLIPLLANIASGDGSLKTFKLTAGASKEFGRSVAVSGDTMVVGDPIKGAAYVFEYDGSNWSQVAELTPSSGFSFFGWSVAISGDMVAVGAPYDQSFLGSVYLFRRVGGSWNEDPDSPLTDSKRIPFSFVGWSVAFAGDTLLVGAPMANSVHVFNSGGTTSWTQQEPPLTGGDTELGDRFGWSVAVSGARLVVGAPRDESTAGSAYVFDFDEKAGKWLETKKLTASNQAERDDFGFSVAIDQDTLVVGAHKDSTYVSNPGVAYIFEFDGESWAEKAKLTASDSADYDEFGYSVAIKDGILLVGAPFDPFYGPEATPGAAYVFEADGSIWSEKLKLSASLAGDPPEQDQFGLAMAINGTTLVVGAILADAEIEDAGAAYLFVANEPPVAVANWDPKEGIIEGDEITLDGSESYDPDGDQLTYHWEQTGGPPVGLDLLLARHDPENPSRTFLAPELSEGCTALSFTLTVTDDKGLASEPAIVEITVYPNNKIYAKLGGKHRRWLYWHKYSFYGHENEHVTIRLEADPNGWHRGRRATLMLKDRIKGVRLFLTNRGGLPNELSATLPADGKYTVYVVKQPWFWFWWRHKRNRGYEGDYILSLEGACGKLVSGFRCNKR